MLRKLPFILPFLAPLLAQPFDLALAPPRLELLLPPGETVQAEVEVSSERKVEVSVRAVGFRLGEDGSLLLEEEGSLCPHLSGYPEALRLEPGERARLTLQVQLPEGAEGTLWCGLLFQGAPIQGRDERGLRVSFLPRILLAVYATPQGRGNPALRVVGMGRGGKEYQVLVENPGNVLLRPSGRLFLYDREGRPVGEVEVEAFPLLPRGRRLLTLPLPVEGGGKALLLLEHAWGRVVAEGVW